MSAIVEGSLKALNYLSNKLPTGVSEKLGKFPIVNSSTGYTWIPKSYFSGWFDFNSSEIYQSALPTPASWLINSSHTIGIMNPEDVILNNPVVVMPKIGMMKKIFIGGALTLGSALVVSFISHQVFKRISAHYSKQEQAGQPAPAQTDATKKTLKAIVIIVGALTALAVGKSAYSILDRTPGIYGSQGYGGIFPHN